jgi:hypothetical protein
MTSERSLTPLICLLSLGIVSCSTLVRQQASPDEQTDVLTAAIEHVRNERLEQLGDHVVAIDTTSKRLMGPRPPVGNRREAAKRLAAPMVNAESLRRCEMSGQRSTETCWLEGIGAAVSASRLKVFTDSATVELDIVQQDPPGPVGPRVSAHGMIVRLRRLSDGRWIVVEARPTWAT